MSNFDEFRFAFDHVEKLLDRRQLTTSFYFSVNTGIFAAVGLLVKDALLPAEWLTGSVLLLLCAGFIACWIWRSLLRQYYILLDWWYARLRDLEAADPDSARLVTQEYEEFYAAEAKSARRLGMTKLERRLNWVFTSLYVVFAVGIALNWLI
jgi:hypothetical protein